MVTNVGKRIFEASGSVDDKGLLTFSINGEEVLKDVSVEDSEYVFSKLKKAVRIQKDILDRKEVKK